jgi:pilus assembly protein CpaB
VAGISMSRRTIALVVAIVLAAVAAVALVSYVTGVKNDAVRGGEAVQVFVAKEQIPAGTSGDSIISQGLIDQKTVPRNVVITGAIGSLSEIQGKVAAVTILQGDQIVTARFVAPGQVTQGGQLLAIPKGFEAMSVEVTTIPGVANFIQPGDTVSILAQLTINTGSNPGPRVQYVLKNVKVLQLGTRVVAPAANGQGPTASVQQAAGKVDLTLALTSRAAEKLAFAVLQGQVYFTLLPPGGKSASTPGRTIRNIFAG